MKSNVDQDLLGGAALLFAALLAMLIVNLGGAAIYSHVLHYELQVGVMPLVLQKSVLHWINDGVMVLFFLLIGVEIHREIRVGNLSTPRQALLPVLAAVGGFAIPAIVFGVLAGSNSDLSAGWSIPTATDIAFAVALLTVFKHKLPTSLRVFLLALAVADDLMAILVIAVFYTSEVIWMNLFLAAAAALLLLAKRKLQLQNMWVYLFAGPIIWLCVLKSGVHATIAGVVIGFLLPLKSLNQNPAPADIVEHRLQPIVRWFVLPLFAFANVGVDLRALGLEAVFSQLTWSIAIALVLGKQVGVFGSVWLLQKAGVPRPLGSTWMQVYGVSCICGIGFTMSLFIGALALPTELQPEVRLGVIVGSTISAVLAVLVLMRTKGSKI